MDGVMGHRVMGLLNATKYHFYNNIWVILWFLVLFVKDNGAPVVLNH
jgi:hypothetical protein